MAARVIDLRSRAEYVPNLVRSTRERLGLSQHEFAAALTARLSWTARPGMVKAWKTALSGPVMSPRPAGRSRRRRGLQPPGR